MTHFIRNKDTVYNVGLMERIIINSYNQIVCYFVDDDAEHVLGTFGSYEEANRVLIKMTGCSGKEES